MEKERERERERENIYSTRRRDTVLYLHVYRTEKDREIMKGRKDKQAE